RHRDGGVGLPAAGTDDQCRRACALEPTPDALGERSDRRVRGRRRLRPAARSLARARSPLTRTRTKATAARPRRLDAAYGPRRRHQMKLAFVICAVLLTLASTAAAQRRDLAQSLNGEAKREYELGRELYRGGDNAGALLKFRHAFDLSGESRLLWNVAVCHKNLRQYDKALPLVDKYLAGGATLTTAERAEATDFRAALTGLVAPVTVTSTPPGAEVFLDGERVGVTPIEKPFLVVAGVAGTRQFRFRL